jgi:hypothetical protein
MVRIERGAAFTQSVSEARQNNSAGSGTVSSAAMVSVAAASAIGDQARLLASPLASNGDGTGNACCLRVSPITGKGWSPSMVWPQPLATFGLGAIASVPEFPCPDKQPKAMLT